jgi:hypothetical protein
MKSEGKRVHWGEMELKDISAVSRKFRLTVIPWEALQIPESKEPRSKLRGI